MDGLNTLAAIERFKSESKVLSYSCTFLCKNNMITLIDEKYGCDPKAVAISFSFFSGTAYQLHSVADYDCLRWLIRYNVYDTHSK